MAMTDVRVLFHLLRGQRRQGSLAQRLQSFYGPQTETYDDFRERLLHGRKELMERLHLPAGARLVDLGGGTGRNLDFLGERLHMLGGVEIVDLCPALLDQARQRERPNVRLVLADAATYRPREPIDCVVFSYSLTMIPEWRAAVDNAFSMLKPGGQIGVVDFFVSEPRPDHGARHGALARTFWPKWFAHDGVHLSPEHLRFLRRRFSLHEFWQHAGPVPYLPGLKAPYYIFVGRKMDSREKG